MAVVPVGKTWLGADFASFLVRQASVIVRVKAPNLLCSLVEHQGNLCLLEKICKISLLKSH